MSIFTEAEARAFIEQRGASRPALGGQLLVGVDSGGWLMGPPESRLARPDRIEWRAAEAYREGGAGDELMPPELTEPAQPRIHVFFALPDAEASYCYLGAAWLGSWGYRATASLGEASLTLAHRLSEEQWLRLGGHAGFSVSAGGRERAGLSAEEVGAEVSRCLAGGETELWITGYDEPSLLLLLNDERAFVTLLRHDGDEGLLAGDPASAGNETPERFRLGNGQVDAFERSRTVTHEQALGCVRAFVTDGTLGAGVRLVE
jgi:hypothetical protein